MIEVKLCGVEGYEEDSDIVVATAGVCRINKSLASGAEAGLSSSGGDIGKYGGDVLVGEFAGEAVGG